MVTNCKNCGAPLHDHICEYCGTEYENKINAGFGCTASEMVNAVFTFTQVANGLMTMNEIRESAGFPRRV